MRITVRVGETRCRVARLAALKPGDLIDLDRQVGEPFELRCGGVLLGLVEPIAEKTGIALKLIRMPEGDE